MVPIYEYVCFSERYILHNMYTSESIRGAFNKLEYNSVLVWLMENSRDTPINIKPWKGGGG